MNLIANMITSMISCKLLTAKASVNYIWGNFDGKTLLEEKSLRKKGLHQQPFPHNHL